jgi:hypothetical protein
MKITVKGWIKPEGHPHGGLSATRVDLELELDEDTLAGVFASGDNGNPSASAFGAPPRVLDRERFPAFRINSPMAIEGMVDEAAEGRIPLAFDYTDAEGSDSSRRVIPFEVYRPARGPWRKVLRCFDLDALDKRSFRVDRMRNVGRLD